MHSFQNHVGCSEIRLIGEQNTGQQNWQSDRASGMQGSRFFFEVLPLTLGWLAIVWGLRQHSLAVTLGMK